MTDLKVVGHSVLKNDAVGKLTGRSLYIADYKMAGMLYGKVLRSKIPHAQVLSIDTAEAEALDGVRAVLTYKDVPGVNRFGIVFKDEPVLVEDRIRQVGDAIALVAADDLETANKALELIKVEYKELPAVFSPFDAIKEDAPQIHGKPNTMISCFIKKGDADKAFEGCDIVIENSYTTQSVDHCPIEPEGALAYYEGDTMVVRATSQNVHYNRKEVAANLDIPQNKARVIQATTGGGFGGKLDIHCHIHAALLAHYTKKPVRIIFDREESFVSTVKRHPYHINYKTGADKDGIIKAIKVKIYCDTGAYASYGPGVVKRALVHASGPYGVENVDIDAYSVYTNNPKAGAMRGFGVPQVAFAHESQMDILAGRLGVSPVEIRIKNALKKGMVTATMQTLHESVGYTETLEKASAKAEEILKIGKECPGGTDEGTETKKKAASSCLSEAGQQETPIKRGVGVGSMWYGVANTAMSNPASVFLDLLDDGTVIILTGCADIGQGSDTILAQIAAEKIGIDFNDVVVVSGDTGVSPDAGATSASRQTYISGNAVLQAAERIKEQLLAYAAKMLKTEVEKITFTGGKVFVKGEETLTTVRQVVEAAKAQGLMFNSSGCFNPDATAIDPVTGEGKPYATYSFATQIAQVEVDTKTGMIDVLNIVAAHDVGKAINPVNVEGQIQGGCGMGLSYGLFEEMNIKNGVIKNPRLSSYLIPTSADMPRVYPIIVEDPESSGPYGAKGVGEPALIPTAAAIVNAVENAIGIRIYDLPLTPERVLAAIEKKELEENRSRYFE